MRAEGEDPDFNQGPPRKRSRSETMDADDMDIKVGEATRRDEEYYFEDGSAVILVDGVLFKVRCYLF